MHTLNDYFQLWADYLQNERRYSKHTLDNYQRDIRQFLTFLTFYLGTQITIDTIVDLELPVFRAWLVHRKKENYHFRATARAISSVKNFYRYLARFHELVNTHISKLKTPSIPEALPKALTTAESKIALSEISSQSNVAWINARNEALALLMYGCGLRISEALSITSLQLQNKQSLTVMGKGNKQRQIPLLPVVYQSLEKYLSLCPFFLESNDPIFRGVKGKPLRPEMFQKILRDIRRQYQLPETTTPHALRHSFATHLLTHHPEGMDPLRFIQQLLGHESLSTTQRYTKIDSEYLLETYQKAHPKANK